VNPSRIRCALLAGYASDWAASVTLLCSTLEFLTLPAHSVGLRESPNPFDLPETDDADVVLVATSWYAWLQATHPDRAGDVMNALHGKARTVVGLDGVDEFALGFPPAAVEHFAVLIKPQGVYRDRDLYNYEVGASYPGARWTEKQRPRRIPYRDRDLEKLRLSFPCFLLHHPASRRAARLREGISLPQVVARATADRFLSALGFAGALNRRLQVHCVVTLTHVQRIEAASLLEGFTGRRGITRVPGLIAGTEHGLSLPEEIRRDVLGAAQPYLRPPVGRLRYEIDLRRHQVVVAPTGYGELTYRHAEAWRAGAALVCQDLSHIEMQLPVRDQHNAVFCRPDLSDLRAQVETLLRDDETRQGIAAQGRRSFQAWSKHWRDHLYGGLEVHLREALGS
jgi:Glycosyl transferases group 1